MTLLFKGPKLMHQYVGFQGILLSSVDFNSNVTSGDVDVHIDKSFLVLVYISFITLMITIP